MDINITAEDKKQPLRLGITKDELALWKQQHQEVLFIRIKVTHTTDLIGAWLKMPTLDIIRLVQDTAKQHGELDALEQLYINCQLKASPEIEKNTKYKLSLLQRLDVLLQTYEAEILKY